MQSLSAKRTELLENFYGDMADRVVSLFQTEVIPDVATRLGDSFGDAFVERCIDRLRPPVPEPATPEVAPATVPIADSHGSEELSRDREEAVAAGSPGARCHTEPRPRGSGSRWPTRDRLCGESLAQQGCRHRSRCVKQTRQHDHLSSWLTDLMTSPMIIFVLLLVSRLNNQAGWRAVAAAELERRLQAQTSSTGQQATVGRAADDPNTIVIDIPDALISFDIQQSTLKPSGESFLEAHIPAWASIMCASDIRPNIDNIVVEGHSDQTRWQNSTFEESKEKNPVLSQGRSMAVVRHSLQVLSNRPDYRDCFLRKLSATGRGEEEPVDRADPASVRNRRVVFKIRLRPELVGHITPALQSDLR